MSTRAPDDDPEQESPAAVALEQAATEWFFRRDRGFTADEKREFARWIATDEHRQLFAGIEESWREFGRLDHAGETRAAVETSGVMPPKTSRSKRGTVIRLRTAFLAAAAAVALGFILWQRPARLDPPARQIVSADRGTTRTVSLPDGSSVQLNTESAIEIQFVPGERGVRLLRGEAHFTVAKNPALPFVVRIGEFGVRAVGTAFNVRLRPEVLEVLVTEGSVRVIAQPSSARPVALEAARNDLPVLTAGEMAVIAVRGVVAAPSISVVVVPPAGIEQAMTWHKRRLEYADASLEQIVADFNRYNTHRLVIADARLAQRRFGATFPAGDYDSLVRLLESTFGVIAERRADETILRLP